MYRWTALWALGAVLLIVGVISLFVPAIPQQSNSAVLDPRTVTPSQRWYFVEDNVSGYSITGEIPVLVSWNAGADLYLDYSVCASPPSGAASAFYSDEVPPGCNPWVYGPHGENYSVSVNQPNGGSILLAWATVSWGPSNVSMSYTIWTPLPFAGPVLLTAGSISIGLGVILVMAASGREKEESASTGSGTGDPSAHPSVRPPTEPK